MKKIVIFIILIVSYLSGFIVRISKAEGCEYYEDYYLPYDYYITYTDELDEDSCNSILSKFTDNANIEPHDETYLSVIFRDTTTNLFGFIDKTSLTYHPAIYHDISDLFCRDASYPILVMNENGDCLYVDRITNTVLFHESYILYGVESEFRNGFAIVFKHGNEFDYPSLINLAGETISFPDSIIPDGAVQDNGMLIVRIMTVNGNLRGVCNVSGDIILEPQFDMISEYHNGFACVRLGCLWGHINEDGNILQYPCYELSEDFDEGYIFKEDGTATFELMDGNVITIKAYP